MPSMNKLGLALLCASLAFAQAPVAVAPAGAITGVSNFVHIVKDLDVSLEYYRDALGMEVGVNQPYSVNPAIEKLGNTPGAQSRYVTLKAPGGSDIGVELIEYKNIDRKPQSPRFQDPGAANYILRVRDANKVFQAVQAFQAKHKLGRVISVAGKPIDVAGSPHVFLQDPDGFVIEVAQGAPTPGSNVPETANVLGGGFELAIRDTDESVKFYSLLGMTMTPAAAFNDNAMMADTAGVPGAKFRQSRSPIPGTRSTLTLIEFQGKDKALDRKALTGRVQDPGTAILQLRVADVAALTKKLKDAGVPVITTGGAPVEVAKGLNIAIVRDPNNLYLELIETRR